MIKCLNALEGLRRLDEGTESWESAIDGLEDAIEGLDTAHHHLLRGTLDDVVSWTILRMLTWRLF